MYNTHCATQRSWLPSALLLLLLLLPYLQPQLSTTGTRELPLRHPWLFAGLQGGLACMHWPSAHAVALRASCFLSAVAAASASRSCRHDVRVHAYCLCR